MKKERNTAIFRGTADRHLDHVEQWIGEIEQRGYCIIPECVRECDIRSALALIREWWPKTRHTLPDNLPSLAKDQPMIWNLQSKDVFFLKLLFGAAHLEQMLCHFLNDRWYKAIPGDRPNYILRSYLARSSNAALPLHIDSMIPYVEGPTIVMQCLIVLEDMNESNGCTLLVPGSHRSGRYADQAALEEAVPLAACAGDMILWDSRLWHGAASNRNKNSTRWCLIATFCRWWIKQGFDITGTLPESIYNQLSDDQKSVLGFCSIPFRHESSGIDFRLGYKDLPDAPDDNNHLPG